MKLTAIARIPLAILECAEEFGLSRTELIRQADLREEDLADPDSRIPEHKIEELWRRMVAADVPNPGFRVGQSLALKAWGIVGYTMVNSGTFGDALARMNRYAGIMNEALDYRLETGGDRSVQILDGSPHLDRLRPAVDARVLSVAHGLREITEPEVVPIEAGFRYDRPADTSEHVRLLGCPVFFGRPNTALVFRREDLNRTLHVADRTLGGYLEQLADQVVKSLGGDGTYAEAVQRAIWSRLNDGAPALQAIARHLGVSARTLQRRLREEGTTFAAVLDALRREMAVLLLRERHLAVYEVAYLLGYSDPSTFHRAFRKWHGNSPLEFRRALV